MVYVEDNMQAGFTYQITRKNLKKVIMVKRGRDPRTFRRLNNLVLIEFRMKREEEPLEKIEAKENAAHTLTHKLWDSKKSSARAKGILVNYSR